MTSEKIFSNITHALHLPTKEITYVFSEVLMAMSMKMAVFYPAVQYI
ncbi:hypothetical protein L798_13948 [Zootermopsis nevadensis]|uniref:Uncharacterized protein n=1 Tax=Zootermopsis nevadensis TaxID=136037 RepID=A0A067QS95_ZOONE|nr:hypothetical protein L798_13948 [Zootermopsis nevadensis]